MSQEPPASATPPPNVTTERVARNTLLNYTSSVFNLINGVALSTIIARSLGPERLGIYSSASFIVGLTIAIFSFGIGATIIKVLSEYGARFGAPAVARTVQLFAFAVAMPAFASAAGVWLALHFTNRQQQYVPIVMLAAGVAAVPAYLAQIYRNIVTGFQDFVFLLRMNLGAAVLLLACTASIAFYAPTVQAFLVAAVAPNLVVVGTVLHRYRGYLFTRAQAVTLPRDQLAGIFSYLWPVALVSVLDMIVWQYSEVLFLGAYRPPREVAFYTIAFSLSSLLLRSVASSVTAGFMPALSQLYGLGHHDRIRTAFYTGLRFSLLFTVPLMALISVVARPTVLLLYGRAFGSAASYVPALVVSAGLGTISGVAADVLYSTRSQHAMLRLAAMVAALNLSLDALLIPSYGVPGAVIANIAAQAASAFATMGLLFVRFRQPLSPRAYLGPLLAASLVLAATWPIAAHLRGIPAILSIGTVGVVTYLVGLRLFAALTAGDAKIIASIAEHVPHAPTRKLLLGVLRFCSPSYEAT